MRSTPMRALGALCAALSLVATTLFAARSAQAAPAPTSAPTSQGYERWISPTPYMGWNTYYGLGSFDEAKIKAAADKLSTMRSLGYKYVWLDGGWWQGQRNADGSIAVDAAQWPSGMKAVADYIHSKGLNAGIYTDIGSTGCGGPGQGSYGHYQQDADTFAAWGYDAVKVDWCGGAVFHWGEAQAQLHYTEFSQALLHNTSDRPMLYNICIWQDDISANQYSWAPQVANSYRVAGDEGSTNAVAWPNLVSDIDRAAAHPDATGAGYYADPDYVNVGVPNLNDTEGRAQMSMWSMLSAPLILGTNIMKMSPATVATVSNNEVIAIDQDPRVAMATKTAEPSPGLQVWTKRLAASNERAVALFNRTGAAATISTTASALGLPPAYSYDLRDVWQHTDAESAGRITAFVPAHGVALYRVRPNQPADQMPPSTSLSVSTAPIYAGSDLHLAAAGQALPVTSTVENDGRALVNNVSVAFSAPQGWLVQPTSARDGQPVRTNETWSTVWTVTPPAGTTPGTYVLATVLTYRWDGHGLGTATSETAVTVPPPPPPAGTSYLSDHAWLDATSGWRTPQRDHEVGGAPMSLQGHPYAKGIGVATPSQIEFYLGGGCTNASATVGIDDSVRFDPAGGTAVFQVVADGQKIYDSGVVTRDAPLQSFSVNVTGAKVLALLVNDAGDGGYNDRADWANLQVTCG
ncbi:MAG: NPCBM/NEW2 domain-containing protein [Chloroflexi bacterium]|nr:NPCBM/NEW2 domain-containing protein [Chloroflexota bacterium]